MQIQITSKALGDLIIALSNQLKQDATLCAILDTVLAETAENGSAPTTAQVCDAVMQAAAEELTDETNPLNVFIGLDESGNLLYLSMFAENDDGTYFTINYIAGRLEDSDASLFNVDVLTLSAEQEIIDGFSCVLAYTVDEENPQVMSAEMVLGGYAEGTEILSFSFSLGQTEAILDGQTGYEGLFAMALGAFDGESTAVVSMDGSMTSCPTANNGEQLIIQGSMNVLADAEEIPMTFEGSVLTTVADGFPIATMTEAAFLPELGISEWREFYTLRAEPMTADEAMTETALESASPEDLEALAGRAMTNMEQTLTTLYELLPPELTENASAA